MIPHDAPSAEQLVEAVREWIERDLGPHLDGRLQFHARVAANVLAIVERELRLGADQAAVHAARLAEVGCADDAELAARIRDHELDDRIERVRALVRDSVLDKLAVSNPKYINPKYVSPSSG